MRSRTNWSRAAMTLRCVNVDGNNEVDFLLIPKSVRITGNSPGQSS